MKKTILLILVNLAVLCGFLVFMNYKIFDQDTASDQLIICNETVSSISVESASNVKFTLTKQSSSEWLLIADKLQYNANIFAVDNLLFELGVAAKNGTLLLKNNNGNQSECFVRVNISGKEYVLYCERESVLAEMLSGDIFQFVDSKVFSISAGITELFVKIPERNLEHRFVRRSDVFFLDSAAQLPIDSSLMSDVISHVKTLHFTKFSDARKFLDENCSEIKIYDSKRCEFVKFVSDCNRVVATKEGMNIAMELDPLDVTQFLNSVCAAASVNVLPKIAIDTIEVFDNVANKEFFLQKLEEVDVWNLLTKNNGKIVNFRADSQSVFELITALLNMKSVNVFDEKLVNLSGFHKKLSVNLDGDRSIKFDILEKDDAKICVKNDSKVVFEIGDSIEDILSRGISFFRDKILFALPDGSTVSNVSISKIDSENDRHDFVSYDQRVVTIVEYANRFVVNRYIEDFEIIQRTVKFEGMSVLLDCKIEFDVELAGVASTKSEKICIKFNRPKSQDDKMFGYYEIQGTFFECTDVLKAAILSLI